ncbi:MAG: hypothetical protein ACOX6K_03550 [Sphaerochaetaceae bacterium]
MKYITIVARNYDEAVRKGRAQYGDELRIHSRRDIPVRGGFLWLGKRTKTEITCYLAEGKAKEAGADRELLLHEFEQEAKTPAPDSLQADTTESASVASAADSKVAAAPQEQGSSSFDTLLEHGRGLLARNDFSEAFIDSVLEAERTELETGDSLPTLGEFELQIVDRIVAAVDVDHSSQLHPPKIFILLGPTGIGKTTTIAKIAALYGTLPPVEFRRKVAIITLDTFRIGAIEQMSSFGEALGIPVFSAQGEDEFYRLLDELSDYDLLLVDTIGKSPRDKELAVKMKTLLSVPPKEHSKCYLAVSASMKSADIEKALEQFGPFGIQSLIVTKVDETQTIGNIVSVSAEHRLPMLFLTDGQKVPRDIHKASSAYILNLLQGFGMDFGALWENQISR